MNEEKVGEVERSNSYNVAVAEGCQPNDAGIGMLLEPSEGELSNT
jgi:hypothetical protein